MTLLLALGPLSEFLLAAIAMVAFFAIIWVACFCFIPRFFGKRRTDALQAAARSLNLSFSKEGSDSFAAFINGFDLFSRGTRQEASNVFSGHVNGTDITIMDYRFTVPGGNSGYVWTTTVIVLQSSLLRLPASLLRPEMLNDKIGGIFGYQDIDFESHPKFSKRYVVEGDDEEAVRNIFTDCLLAYYEEHTGLHTEGDGDTLLVYRSGRRIAAQKIRSRLDEGFAIFELVKARA